MRRRHFFAGSILAVGSVSTGIYLYRSNEPSPEELAVVEVAGKLAELPGAVRFGETFSKRLRKDGQDIRSAQSISSFLADTHGAFDSSTIGRILDKQILADLERDQIQRVHGWYLTRTELDLCALASAAIDA